LTALWELVEEVTLIFSGHQRSDGTFREVIWNGVVKVFLWKPPPLAIIQERLFKSTHSLSQESYGNGDF
jgi:hypothetical protein